MWVCTNSTRCVSCSHKTKQKTYFVTILRSNTIIENDNDQDAIREIFLRTLGREPTDTESKQSRSFVAAQAASYPKDGRKRALADLCQVMFGLNEFIFIR